LKELDPLSRGETPTLELVESLMALRRTLRCVEHAGETSGSLGFAALGVLAYIQRHQPTRATDVAQWIGIGPAALSRQVAELEGAGLLVRAPSPTDARAQLISLTPRGAEELGQAYTRRAGLLAEMLKDWDEAKISAAAATVNEIQGVLRVGLDARGGKTTMAPRGPEENPNV
jgi:DNA-binding MarR family transcriptional regulator